MIRNPHRSGPMPASTFARGRAGRWLPSWRSRWAWAGLLLALALSLGGARSTPAAQAAPAGDYSKKIYMLVTKAGSAERTICVGDKVVVRARVAKVVKVVDTGDVLSDGLQFAPLYGVPLEASVADPGIGSISPASSVTSLDADPVGEARFTFAAKKAGTTTVKVVGKVIKKELFGVALSSETVSGEITVTVEKCEYRVNATAIWRSAPNATIIAVITDAALAQDGDGKYQGNADVSWAELEVAPPCTVIHYGPAPSRAFITGETLGSDLMEVKVIYEQTPSLGATVACPPIGIVERPESVMLGAESLRFWVLTSGGSATRHPALEGAPTFDGTVIVDVRPVPSR